MADMTINKIDSFNEKAKNLFQNLITDYGYKLEGVNIFEYSGMKWSTTLVYINNLSNLKIEIQQAPYYTDYGFSFFIYKIGTEEYNLLYNVPHETQETEDKFLLKAHKDLFSTDETVELIRGKKWQKLSHMPLYP
jgi:hypothetical protein